MAEILKLADLGPDGCQSGQLPRRSAVAYVRSVLSNLRPILPLNESSSSGIRLRPIEAAQEAKASDLGLKPPRFFVFPFKVVNPAVQVAGA